MSESEYDYLKAQVAALQEENKKLRSALEKYANRNNWEAKFGGMGGYGSMNDVFNKTVNGWEIAEKVIEEVDNV